MPGYGILHELKRHHRNDLFVAELDVELGFDFQDQIQMST